jgi:hypothetical protein
MRYLIGVIASAGIAAAVVVAPVASADPSDEVSNLPTCTTTGDGSGYTGTTTTECASPGNVQINAAAPEPVYSYPWDDEFYGPALIIGDSGPDGPHGGDGGGGGPHGGGGGGGGGGHR